MNLTKLSQAGGIAYLMNTVISGDTPRAGGSGLSAYYAAAGTPPGRWLGKGAEAIGITTGWHVSQEGAESLFRRGAHPITGVPLGGRPVQLHAEMDAPVVTDGGHRAGHPATAAPGAGGQVAGQVTGHGGQGTSHVAGAAGGQSGQVSGQVAGHRGHATSHDSGVAGGQVAGQAAGHAGQGTSHASGAAGGQVAVMPSGQSAATGGGQSVSATKVAGYDLTFTVPKSVSVLWGTASDQTRQRIMDAHHRAIDQTLEYFEREVLQSRSGRGGVVATPVVGMVGARFDHFDTRDGDPHLHSHVVIANKVQRRSDGKWLTVDGRTVYQAAVALSEIHSSLLLDELHRELGMTFAEPETPRASDAKAVVLDVVGVPAKVVERFSSRAARITALEAELLETWRAEHGGAEPSRRQRARLHQQAWAATRAPKSKTVRPLGDLIATWRAQLAGLGHDPQDLEEASLGHAVNTIDGHAVAADPQAVADLAGGLIAHHDAHRPLDGVEQLAKKLLQDNREKNGPKVTDGEARAFVTQAGREAVHRMAGERATSALERSRSTWTVMNVRAEAERLTRHVRTTNPAAREALREAITAAVLARCTQLTPTLYEVPDVARDDPRLAHHGASVFDDPQMVRYTTERILDAEALIDRLTTTTGAPALDVDHAEATLARLSGEQQAERGFAIATDQLAAAHAVTTSGRVVDAIVGPAGTGKTTTMRAVRHAWESVYGPASVIGLTTSARAAAELSSSLGIEASTLSKFTFEQLAPENLPTKRALAAKMTAAGTPRSLAAAQRIRAEITAYEALYQVKAGQLVIVDEASMSSTDHLAHVASIVERAGAKLLLVGDPAQLDAVEAGGVLGRIERDRRAHHLTSVWRFAAEWEAAASLRLRHGDLDVIDVYAEHGRIREGGDLEMSDGAYDAARADQSAGHSTLLIAATNAQVDELNMRFTLDRRTTGEVDTSRTCPIRAGRDAALGDVIVARKTNRRITDTAGDFIRNGELLVVEQITDQGEVIARRQDSSVRITLPAAYMAQEVELGYATTAHRCQGMTVDRAHLVISSDEHMTRELLYVAMTRGRHANTAWVGILDEQVARELHVPLVDIPTAHDVLTRALGTQGAELTAHEVRDNAQREAVDLQRLLAQYEYLAALASEPRCYDTLAELLGAETARELKTSPSWDALVATWRTAEHLDPARTARLLTLPVPDREEVLDLAAVYHSRLEDAIVAPATHQPPPDWIARATAPLHTTDPAVADAAGQVAARIGAQVAHVTDLEHLTGADAPTWVQRLGPRPEPEHLAAAWDRAVQAIALYRAVWHVRTTSPLGPRPYGTHRRHDRAWVQANRHLQTWDKPADPGDDTDPPHDVDATPEPPAGEYADVLAGEEPPPPDDAPEPPPDPLRERVIAANTAAWAWWQASTPGSWVPDYLTERGLGDVDAAHAPNTWTALTDHLRSLGYDDQEIVDAGLATISRKGTLIDRFRDRLVLPVIDASGDLVAFTARANPLDARPDTPKYINSPTTVAYDKSATLLGLDHAAATRLHDGARPVIVEGAMDLEAVRTLGASLVPLAPCGTALTQDQLNALRRIRGGELNDLVLALDADDAGRKAALRTWTLLTPTEAEHATVATLPDGADPAQLVQDGLEHDLHRALTAPRPLVDVLIDTVITHANLEHLEGRVSALRTIAHAVAPLSVDAITRTRAELLARLDGLLEETTITDELINAHLDHQQAAMPKPSIGVAAVDLPRRHAPDLL